MHLLNTGAKAIGVGPFRRNAEFRINNLGQ
jgi:hypothetical protein